MSKDFGLKQLSDTPGILIAACGFGAALVTKDTFILSASSTVPPAEQAVLFFWSLALTLLVVTVLYFIKPSFRFSRYPALTYLTSICTSAATLLPYVDSSLSSDPLFITLYRIVFQIGSTMLLLFWIETILPFGSKRSSLIFSFACIAAGALTTILAITALDFEKGVIAFLSVFSITCLYFFKEYNSSRRGFDLPSPVVESSDSTFSFTLSRSKRQIGVLLTSCFIPFFCYRYAFGEVAYAWIDSSESLGVSTYSQVANALGMALAGLAVLGFVLFFWKKQNFVLVMIATLITLFFAMYLASSSDGKDFFTYLLMVSMGQKLIVYLTILVSFVLYRTSKHSLMFSASLSLFLSSVGIATYSSISSIGYPAIGTSIMVILLVIVIFCIIAVLYLGQKGAEENSSGAKLEKDGRPNNTDHQKLCVEIASLYTLTNREKDILILLADRYNSNDIAEKLVLSVHTVKTHMKNLYAKLGVHSQKDLIALVESLNDGKPLF